MEIARLKSSPSRPLFSQASQFGGETEVKDAGPGIVLFSKQSSIFSSQRQQLSNSCRLMTRSYHSSKAKHMYSSQQHQLESRAEHECYLKSEGARDL